MGKTATAKQPQDTEGLAPHFVLYADGYPVHSCDSRSECESEKLNHAYDARRGGKATPKFHIVQRKIIKGEKVSDDTIVDGDKENPPAGLTEV